MPYRQKDPVISGSEYRSHLSSGNELMQTRFYCLPSHPWGIWGFSHLQPTSLSWNLHTPGFHVSWISPLNAHRYFNKPNFFTIKLSSPPKINSAFFHFLISMNGSNSHRIFQSKSLKSILVFFSLLCHIQSTTKFWMNTFRKPQECTPPQHYCRSLLQETN